MQFQVPQFINIEDKIVGPFTVKQFVYLVGGLAATYIIYHFLPFYLAIIAIAPFVTFALLLAFAKPNGKPFINTVQAAITYALGNRLYIWKQRKHTITPLVSGKGAGGGMDAPVMSESKLKDLTWALDINQNVRGQRK